MKINNIILLFVYLFKILQSRAYQYQLSFFNFRKTSQHFIFITKIQFNQGVSSINISTKIRGIPNTPLSFVQLALIQTNSFIEGQTNICDDRWQFFKHKIQSNGTQTNTFYNLNLTEKQSYSIILRDCSKVLVNQYSNYKLFMNLDLVILNNDSHLGQQQKNWYILIGLFALSYYLFVTIYKNNKSGPQFDYCKLLISIAIFFNMAALFLKIITFIIYMRTGFQYGTIQLFFLIFHSISEVFILCIILFMSYGWTINYMGGSDFDIFIPLITLLSVINILLTTLTKLNDQDHNKYHVYDSIPGIILIFIRLFLFMLLILGFVITCKGLKQPNLKDKRIFLYSFSIISGYYMFSLYINMKICDRLDLIMRKEGMLILMMLTQELVLMYLCYININDRSRYKKINYRNSSPFDSFDLLTEKQKKY